MPTIPLHPPITTDITPTGPFPQVLKTPTGLALIEIQGVLNFPSTSESSEISVGNLIFPNEITTGEWGGKKVFFYVGKHQRMTGEVQKLKTPLAVLKRRGRGREMDVDGEEGSSVQGEELEVVEIIRQKIIFKDRPEPVSLDN